MATRLTDMSVEVNGFTLEWSSSSKRKWTSCPHCGVPTQGLAEYNPGTDQAKSEICCMPCAMKPTMQHALAGLKVIHG